MIPKSVSIAHCEDFLFPLKYFLFVLEKCVTFVIFFYFDSTPTKTTKLLLGHDRAELAVKNSSFDIAALFPRRICNEKSWQFQIRFFLD